MSLSVPIADAIVTAACLLGAAALPREPKRRLFLAFARLSKRHWGGGLAAIALLVIAARLCFLPILPCPTPLIPDEHSHLLLARTLAAGRFANPSHPMWRHFETLFVLQRPAYASAYPPVQGALLAAGSVLVGHPWAGVLASVAGMCLAIGWMLRAYMPRDWALFGSALAGAGYGVLTYWSNSYWGGAGAAIGGAMVFGALPRMLSNGRRRDAAILGCGLLILANSRPYEGFLAAVPVAFAVIRYLVKTRHRGTALRTQAPVLACVLLAGAALTGWYTWRVTGRPLRLPHSAYIQQYAAAPAFVWQAPQKAPEYGDRVLRDAHLSFGISYADYSTLTGAARKTWSKLSGIATFYWGPLWALGLLALPGFLRERRFRIVLFAAALSIAGILLTVGFQPHYAAPCASIFVLILVDACRRVSRQSKKLGAAIIIAAPAAWIGSQALLLRTPPAWNSLRARLAVESRIAAEPGRHVVIVHYGPAHPLGQEWVYNEPDIDRSQIIWARDLGLLLNQELIRYYPDRTFWIAEPDYPSPRISRCAPNCGLPDENDPTSLMGVGGKSTRQSSPDRNYAP